MHCGAREARFSFTDLLRQGGRVVAGARAASIGLWLSLVGLIVLEDGFRVRDAEDLVELGAAVFAVWAFVGLVFGGALLGVHALTAKRLPLKLSLCAECERSAQWSLSWRALFEVGSILGAVLTLIGLAIFLSAPPSCACEGHHSALPLLVFVPGLLLPASALGRLALWFVRRDREVTLGAIDPHHVEVGLPRPMAAHLRRERPDLIR